MNLIQSIKKHEGWRSKLYVDSVGVKTIGYGINLEQQEMPKAVAELWLSMVVSDIKNKLREYEWYIKLNGDRRKAIIDMAYNLGIPGLLKFKNMIAAIKENNYRKAAKEMIDSKWASQVGKRATDLAKIMSPNENIGI